MSNPIISIENLGKSYLIGHQSANPERYTALRDVLGRSFKAFSRKFIDLVAGRQIVQGDSVEEFWALDDISLEIEQGEVVGIIGRNGAGKSTLLKVLSRITEPTKGQVTLRGRVASLLEVGTGFHPELTGRENIFLNGAILGMRRVEIETKFDEIVDFSGVEKFLDTPVKRYSSGMYVRLAFAVAAHLDPEILVVDEVLAVGDSEFQKKCLGKMKDVASSGRTVLFVSHNIRAIRSLTQRCAVLKSGRLLTVAGTEEAIEVYHQDGKNSTIAETDVQYFRRNKLDSNSSAYIESVYVVDSSGNQTKNLIVGEPIQICVDVVSTESLNDIRIAIAIKKISTDEIVFHTYSSDSGASIGLNKGRNTVGCSIGELPITPGDCVATIGIARDSHSAAFDQIVDYPIFDCAHREELGLEYIHRPWGCIFLNSVQWSVSTAEKSVEPT